MSDTYIKNTGSTNYEWCVLKPVDSGKETYENIVSEIYGKPVLSVAAAFMNCSNIQKSPKMPDCIINMANAFDGRTTLKTIENIPSSVKNLGSAFAGCESLVDVPEIPVGVESMAFTFSGCTKLTNLPENFNIPATVTNMAAIFYGCTSLKGEITINANIIPANGKADGAFMGVNFTGQGLTLIGNGSNDDLITFLYSMGTDASSN